MRIITTTCSECGLIVAGNVLESDRVMKCPGIDCEAIHRFEDLDDADQRYLTENRDRYSVE